MKEQPILFNGSMVRAILDGRKTQTRRVVKGIALDWLGNAKFTPEYVALPANGLCSYGQPGDRLWVREAYFGNHFMHPNEPENERELHYLADGLPDFEGEESQIRWRPSIHMPRWASRITLEITGVRVERLQDISEADAVSEGFAAMDEGIVWHSASDAFSALWKSINGVESWYANPWVWVFEFKRVTP